MTARATVSKIRRAWECNSALAAGGCAKQEDAKSQALHHPDPPPTAGRVGGQPRSIRHANQGTSASHFSFGGSANFFPILSTISLGTTSCHPSAPRRN